MAPTPDQCGLKSLASRLPGLSDGALDGFGVVDPGRPLNSTGPAGNLRRVSLSASQPSLVRSETLQHVSPSASPSSLVRSETLATRGIRESDARRDVALIPPSPTRTLVQIDTANFIPPAGGHPLDQGRSVLSMQNALTLPAEQTAAYQGPEVQYDNALQNLAASMRRTEATRIQVMRLRRTLNPGQLRALARARDRLDRKILGQLRCEQEREQAQLQLLTAITMVSLATIAR